MNWSKRLINLVNRMATGTKKTRTLLTPIGIIFFCSIMTIILVGAVIVDTLLHLPRLLPEEIRLGISIPFLATGLAVIAWSVVSFFQAKGTPVPFNPPPQVVTTGPYKYSRNPMFTGVFLFLFGAGFFLNSISLVFFFTPLFIICIVWGVRKVEEPELIKRLGNDYLNYRERTPMFLPRFPRKRR